MQSGAGRKVGCPVLARSLIFSSPSSPLPLFLCCWPLSPRSTSTLVDGLQTSTDSPPSQVIPSSPPALRRPTSYRSLLAHPEPDRDDAPPDAPLLPPPSPPRSTLYFGTAGEPSPFRSQRVAAAGHEGGSMDPSYAVHQAAVSHDMDWTTAPPARGRDGDGDADDDDDDDDHDDEQLAHWTASPRGLPLSDTLLYTPLPAATSSLSTSSRQTRSPRKTIRLTPADRRAICEHSRAHPEIKQDKIGLLFGVERSTVSKILKFRDKWLAEPASRAPESPPQSLTRGGSAGSLSRPGSSARKAQLVGSTSGSRAGSPRVAALLAAAVVAPAPPTAVGGSRYPTLESALYVWATTQAPLSAAGPTDAVLLQQAKVLVRALPECAGFKPSASWLTTFKARAGWSVEIKHEDSAELAADVVAPLEHKLSTAVKKRGACPPAEPLPLLARTTSTRTIAKLPTSTSRRSLSHIPPPTAAAVVLSLSSSSTATGAVTGPKSKPTRSRAAAAAAAKPGIASGKKVEGKRRPGPLSLETQLDVPRNNLRHSTRRASGVLYEAPALDEAHYFPARYPPYGGAADPRGEAVDSFYDPPPSATSTGFPTTRLQSPFQSSFIPHLSPVYAATPLAPTGGGLRSGTHSPSTGGMSMMNLVVGGSGGNGLNHAAPANYLRHARSGSAASSVSAYSSLTAFTSQPSSGTSGSSYGSFSLAPLGLLSCSTPSTPAAGPASALLPGYYGHGAEGTQSQLEAAFGNLIAPSSATGAARPPQFLTRRATVSGTPLYDPPALPLPPALLSTAAVSFADAYASLQRALEYLSTESSSLVSAQDLGVLADVKGKMEAQIQSHSYARRHVQSPEFRLEASEREPTVGAQESQAPLAGFSSITRSGSRSSARTSRGGSLGLGAGGSSSRERAQRRI